MYLHDDNISFGDVVSYASLSYNQCKYAVLSIVDSEILRPNS